MAELEKHAEIINKTLWYVNPWVLKEALKDCQRNTLELILPEEADTTKFRMSLDNEAICKVLGWKRCRSDMLRRASEAGITIDGL